MKMKSWTGSAGICINEKKEILMAQTSHINN